MCCISNLQSLATSSILVRNPKKLKTMGVVVLLQGTIFVHFGQDSMNDWLSARPMKKYMKLQCICEKFKELSYEQ